MAAETAGLVVGGLGALALVDTALNGFERIESGATYGREYNKIALKLSLNELRLTRWKEASSAVLTAASSTDASKVQELVGEIETNFEDAQIAAKRYKQKQAVANLDDASTEAALVSRVRNLAKLRQKTSSLGQKTMWALHDEKKFRRLAEDQTDLIKQLVDLFPATSEQQMQLVRRDAQELVRQPELVQGPEILLKATDEVDPELSFGLKEAATDATHTYRNVRTLDEARAQNGDFVSEGYQGSWSNAIYNFDDIVASGKARQQNGTSYGGKSVFDD